MDHYYHSGEITKSPNSLDHTDQCLEVANCSTKEFFDEDYRFIYSIFLSPSYQKKNILRQLVNSRSWKY